jgi:hypothetical protein
MRRPAKPISPFRLIWELTIYSLVFAFNTAAAVLGLLLWATT